MIIQMSALTGIPCGTLYIAAHPCAATSVVLPTLSSMTISTNGANDSFIGTGATLTLNFNVNQSVNNVKISVNGTQISTNGSEAEHIQFHIR